MNIVTLIGRLTKAPEVRYTNDQKAVASFTVAVDRYSKDKEKSADFIRCKAFGKTAELIERFCDKGKMVGIRGRIQTGSYESNGETKYTTDVMVDEIKFLSNDSERSSADNYAPAPSPSPATAPRREYREQQQTIPASPYRFSDEPTGFQVTDDDIPF